MINDYIKGVELMKAAKKFSGTPVRQPHHAQDWQGTQITPAQALKTLHAAHPELTRENAAKLLRSNTAEKVGSAMKTLGSDGRKAVRGNIARDGNTSRHLSVAGLGAHGRAGSENANAGHTYARHLRSQRNNVARLSKSTNEDLAKLSQAFSPAAQNKRRAGSPAPPNRNSANPLNRKIGTLGRTMRKVGTANNKELIASQTRAINDVFADFRNDEGFMAKAAPPNRDSADPFKRSVGTLGRIIENPTNFTRIGSSVRNDLNRISSSAKNEIERLGRGIRVPTSEDVKNEWNTLKGRVSHLTKADSKVAWPVSGNQAAINALQKRLYGGSRVGLTIALKNINKAEQAKKGRDRRRDGNFKVQRSFGELDTQVGIPREMPKIERDRVPHRVAELDALHANEPFQSKAYSFRERTAAQDVIRDFRRVRNARTIGTSGGSFKELGPRAYAAAKNGGANFSRSRLNKASGSYMDNYPDSEIKAPRSQSHAQTTRGYGHSAITAIDAGVKSSKVPELAAIMDRNKQSSYIRHLRASAKNPPAGSKKGVYDTRLTDIKDTMNRNRLSRVTKATLSYRENYPGSKLAQPRSQGGQASLNSFYDDIAFGRERGVPVEQLADYAAKNSRKKHLTDINRHRESKAAGGRTDGYNKLRDQNFKGNMQAHRVSSNLTRSRKGFKEAADYFAGR